MSDDDEWVHPETTCYIWREKTKKWIPKNEKKWNQNVVEKKRPEQTAMTLAWKNRKTGIK